MLRIVTLAAVVLVAVMALAVPAGNRARGDSVSYVSMGDSLSAVYGYVNMYHAQLETDLGTEVDMTLRGVGGATSGHLRTSLETDPAFRDAVAEADVVTWNIGINDLTGARFMHLAGACGGPDNEDCLRAMLTTFQGNWDGILAALEELNPNAALRTMDVYNPFYAIDAANGDGDVIRGYWEQVNEHINATSPQHGALVAQVYTAYNGGSGTENPVAKGYILSDGLHLTESGNRAVADELIALGYGHVGMDADADGVIDLIDNCTSAPNPDQLNSDRDFVDLSAFGKIYNDITWPNSDHAGDACDADEDNDGLTGVAELSLPGPACPAATARTSPSLRDSDGDGNLDGAECALGSDPANATSKPGPQPGDFDRDWLPLWVEVAFGTDPYDADTDGDTLIDGVETRGFLSSPTNTDTDGDGCGDVYEAASINGDTRVNMMDIMEVANAIGRAGSPAYVTPFDFNRDSAINAIDLGFVARNFGGAC